MIEMNFITKEYKMKLFLENLLKASIVIVVLIVLAEIGVGFYLNTIVKSQQNKIEIVNGKINELNKKNKEIRKLYKNIPDYSSRIQVLNDLVSEKKLRLSEVLYYIKEVTPLKIWYSSLTYKDGKVILKGYAAGKNKNSPEVVALSLEEKFRESKLFRNVIAEGFKRGNVLGNDVVVFTYQLVLGGE
ncbi:PilN domain-containing protein [Haliovirga abyssi]|uniref:PilN domain-containing protein n=1 Tax=Haliovirga abyssi TaxID=2996794 RepID=A0AAU9DE39_9FUSO|nr:hypothetical protein [Haliovirga abyssi]BDU49582.1 hypothetical protein HLVA_01510 [Haliovirga abyssi]